MTLTDEMDNPPRIMFAIGRDDLYRVRIERAELDNIIRCLLRLYSGVFNEKMVTINEQEIAHHSGYTPQRVHELLQRLWQLRIIRYIPGNRSPLLMLNEERLPIKDVYISPESYEIRKKMALQRLDSIYMYGENQTECRSRVIQGYFGEENTSDCGVCDICLQRRKAQKSVVPDLQELIAEALDDSEMQLKELVQKLGGNPQVIIELINRMVDDGKILTDDCGKLSLNR